MFLTVQNPQGFINKVEVLLLTVQNSNDKSETSKKRIQETENLIDVHSLGRQENKKRPAKDGHAPKSQRKYSDKKIKVIRRSFPECQFSL